MKFNSIEELKAKAKVVDAALYNESSEAFGEKAVYDELAKIINIQLNNASLIPEDFRNLLLYINGPNSYVSCHWYHLEKNDTLDECGYTVVTFTAYYDEDVYENLDEDFFFYGLIIDALEKYKLQGIQPLGTVKIYESDQGDEALLIKI